MFCRLNKSDRVRKLVFNYPILNVSHADSINNLSAMLSACDKRKDLQGKGIKPAGLFLRVTIGEYLGPDQDISRIIA